MSSKNLSCLENYFSSLCLSLPYEWMQTVNNLSCERLFHRYILVIYSAIFKIGLLEEKNNPEKNEKMYKHVYDWKRLGAALENESVGVKWVSKDLYELSLLEKTKIFFSVVLDRNRRPVFGNDAECYLTQLVGVLHRYNHPSVVIMVP